MRALRAKNVLTCQRALCAYVLTCQRALRGNVPYVLKFSRVNVSWVLTCLTCQHALRTYVLTCQRVLRAYLLMCQHTLNPLFGTVCVTTWSPASKLVLIPLFSVSLPLLLRFYTRLVKFKSLINVFPQYINQVC